MNLANQVQTQPGTVCVNSLRKGMSLQYFSSTGLNSSAHRKLLPWLAIIMAMYDSRILKNKNQYLWRVTIDNILNGHGRNYDCSWELFVDWFPIAFSTVFEIRTFSLNDLLTIIRKTSWWGESR